MPYAVCFDTMIEEMIARAMHSHPLFLVDNKAVYHLLEEATRNTAYAPSLATFAKKHDGRGASFAIMSQYAGEDKWLAEVKVQEKFMATEWKGQSNFLLEALITQHRNAFTSLQECAEHTSYQVLTEEGRVRKLLDCIVSTNADLCAAVAHVKALGALKTDFEKAAAFLLPACPVAAKRAKMKCGAAEISEVDDKVPNSKQAVPVCTVAVMILTSTAN